MIRYTADIVHGTVMEVTYEGEAQSPDLIFPAVFPNDLPPPRLPRNDQPQSTTTPAPSRLKRQRKTKKYSDYISDTIVPFLEEALSSYSTKELERKARTVPSKRVIRRRRRKKPHLPSFPNISIDPTKELERKARTVPSRRVIKRRRMRKQASNKKKRQNFEG